MLSQPIFRLTDYKEKITLCHNPKRKIKYVCLIQKNYEVPRNSRKKSFNIKLLTVHEPEGGKKQKELMGRVSIDKEEKRKKKKRRRRRRSARRDRRRD